MHVKKHIIFISLLIICISCDEWLEIVPPDGLVKDEYWKTKEDLKATVMGAYQQFASLDYHLFVLGEARADMVIKDVHTIGPWRNIMDGNIFPDNVTTDWLDFYSIINYCNSVLKYAPLIEEADATFNTYMQKGYEAEAIFLRSLAYFYLVRTYRRVPLVLEPSESDGVDFYLPVSDEATVLNQIKMVIR